MIICGERPGCGVTVVEYTGSVVVVVEEGQTVLAHVAGGRTADT